MFTRLALVVALLMSVVSSSVGAEEPQRHSRRPYRVAGVVVTSFAGLALTASAALLPLAAGACGTCATCGCSGGNWGWSAAAGIAAVLAVPIGVGLTVFGYREPGFELKPMITPAGGGLSLSCRF